MKKRNEEITLKDILSVFIPKIWIIAIVSILAAAIMFAYSTFLVSDKYNSSSVMHICKDSETLNTADFLTAESVINVMSYRVFSDDFISMVIANVRENYGDEYADLSQGLVRSSITYSPLGNGMLRVSVLTSNPQLSYAISQALENYIPTEFYNYRPGVFTVVTYDNAELPTSPLFNNSVRNAIIGFVAGAVISAVAVWLYSAFDTVIRDKKKIEDYFDVSVIGVIPSPCEKCVNTEVQ
jgi:capsular polysaccharide biosynthesis protein